MSEQAQESGQPVEEPAQEPDEPTASPGPMTPEEQEQADQDEQGEESGEPEEPEATPLSERDVEQAFAKLDREATRHANRVSEIMEEGAQLLVACPLCEPSIPGFVMPSPAVEERKAGVLLFLGVEAQPELATDPDSSECPTCHGWGKVATGSKTEANRAMVCRQCNGAGAVGPRFTQAAPPIPAPAPVGERNGPPTPTVSPEDQAAIDRLRAQGIVVIPPAVSA